MFKKFLTLAMVAVCAIFASAQTPLPLNPAVKHGTLPNGLNYYILHNEEPKQRANFYIAQKVGSTLETPEQLGLAHFLEHMAFNGTTNFPGKSMLNYLQSKGIRFGADINAYTGFDETVYNVNNVPTTDKALMDSVLLVLHDWSGSILLEEDEINAERGVIEEEWRSRNSAMQRMYESMLPKIYEEYQYQQMPIGKMEIVRNFPPQVIRDYYHKWYRPDQQGIVIVGDFDVAEMEKKVIDLFSTIKMPENAAERTYPEVSDNKEPIYHYFTDKELQYPIAYISFKSDKFPVEFRNTMEYYVQDALVFNVFSQMINNRLSEYSKKPECKYLESVVNISDFFISKTQAAFNVIVVGKDDMSAAIDDALAVVAQACKAGFMQSEVERARDELLAQYEKAYNERNNTNSETLAREIIRHFIDNEPSPGIDKEYELAKQILPMLPAEAFNELGKQILTSENQVIVVSEPTRDQMVELTREQIVGNVEKTLNADYEAYVDEVITDPLIEKLAPAGKITKTEAGQFGTTVFTLSNGAKVMVKPTDFKQDEILFTAVAPGGKQSFAPADAPDVLCAEDAYNYAKQGAFDHLKLKKYLAGKNVSTNLNIGSTSNLFEGRSTVKDFRYLMELINSSFTQLNPDATSFNTELDKVRTSLKNADKDQQQVFGRMVSKATYGNNPMFQTPTVEMLDAVNYDKAFGIAKGVLANPADFTFIFTGNVNIDSIKPMIEKYIASIPAGKKAEVKKLSSIALAKGQVNDKQTLEMAAPSTIVYVDANGTNLPYNVENVVRVDLMGDVLSNIFTDTLREEEGGTYSPYAYANLSPWNGTWQLVYVFQTNDQMQDKLIARANEEFMKLLKNGAPAEQFNKVKEAALKQYEIRERTNGYWSNSLFRLVRGFDDVTGYKAAIENLTVEDFNKFLSTVYDGKNHIQVVLQGVPEKK